MLKGMLGNDSGSHFRPQALLQQLLVDHVIQQQVSELEDVLGIHVQHARAGRQSRPQLEEGM